MNSRTSTKVIFRKTFPELGGELIAVFPSLAGDTNPYRTCLCYAHMGQHSTMSLEYLQSTFPVNNPDEYKSLKLELESLGYNLQVSKRFSRKDLQERIQQTK